MKKQASDHTPSLLSSPPSDLYVSRGAMEHHAIGLLSEYASNPIGVPRSTRFLIDAFLPALPGIVFLFSLVRQTMHQQLCGPPLDSNRCSRSAQRSAVTGWNSSFIRKMHPCRIGVSIQTRFRRTRLCYVVLRHWHLPCPVDIWSVLETTLHGAESRMRLS